MNSLLEFIKYTEGVQYLIAVAFLFGFIAFWQLQYLRRKGVIRVIPAVVLALSFGVLAANLISAKAVTTTPPLTMEAPLLNSAVLEELYGPASFDHELHQSIATDCTVCHHHSGGRAQPCKDCHAAPFDPENLGKPGLAHVYHLRCIGCHKENRTGPTNPTDCTGCHKKADVPPLSIGHPLTGGDTCLSCHGAGIPGVPAVPADHAGATNGVCELCHKPSVKPTAIATRELPHEVTLRQHCLLCHGEGVAGAPKVPTGHAGRTEDTCQICHRSSAKKETVTLSPVEPLVPGTAPAPASVASPKPPALRETPHEVAGRANCLACHGEGIAGAATVPADHAGRTNETCQRCHPAATGPAGSDSGQPVSASENPTLGPAQGEPVSRRGPAVQHVVAGKRWHCNTCHTVDNGLLPTPADHRDYAEDECVNCHTLMSATPEVGSGGS